MLTPDGKKRCADCGELKPATSEFFYRTANTKSGSLCPRCKPCESRYRKRNGRGVYDRIARKMGITRQRVQQLEASALRKLRGHPAVRELLGC